MVKTWSSSELERRREVEDGNAVVASMRAGPGGCRVDENLLSWAEAKKIAVRIDRGTEWGNPFRIPGDGDRGLVITSFSDFYFPRKLSLHRKLPGLRGRVLVCWCHPEPCHGDFLCDQVNGSDLLALVSRRKRC